MIFKDKTSVNLSTIILLNIFFIIPLNVTSNFLNSQKFYNIFQNELINYKLIYIYILIFLLTLLINFTIIFLLKKINKLITILLLFFFNWILLTGFFFPLSLSAGIVDPATAAVNKFNLLIALSLSLIITIYFRKKINVLIIFGYIFIFINIMVILFKIISFNLDEVIKYDLIDAGQKNILEQNILEKSYNLGNKRNLIVISLDGLNSDVVKKIFEENKNYDDTFKDFIFYENAVSQAPATALSLAGEIYGNLDFKEISINQNEIYDQLIQENNIFDTYQDTFTYGPYNLFNKNSLKKVGNLSSIFFNNDLVKEIKKTEALMEIQRYSLTRFGTRVLVNLFDDLKFAAYGKIFKYNKSDLEKFSFQEQLFFHRGVSFDKTSLLDLEVFKKYIDNFKIDKNEPEKISLRFMHFLYSHFPVDLDSNCQYLSYNRKTFKSVQNYNGYKNETKCSIKLLEKLIVKLKLINIYDKSLIILKSDHGHPSNYFDYPPLNLKINNHSHFGLSRYKPLLMIKRINNSNQNITFMKKTFSTNALSKIYCEFVNNIPEICKNNDINTTQIYIPKTKNSSHLIKDLKKINVKSVDQFIEMIK